MGDAEQIVIHSAGDSNYIAPEMKFPSRLSPFLCAWRDCLESRLSDAIFNAQDTDVLLKHLARSPEAIDAVERLIELMPKGHPAHQILSKYTA